MAQALAQMSSDPAKIAKDLTVLVYKDRLVEAGHVDLPSCLNVPVSAANSGDENNRLARVMVGMCRQVRKEYESKFEDMISQMSFSARTGYGQFMTFASELFQAGVTQGKIVSLYVFCAELANACMNNPATLGPHYVNSIMAWQSRCFHETVEEWLIRQEGWASFERTFANKVLHLESIVPGCSAAAAVKKPVQSEWRARMAGMAVVTLGIAYALGS